jgi:hypothetical protein
MGRYSAEKFKIKSCSLEKGAEVKEIVVELKEEVYYPFVSISFSESKGISAVICGEKNGFIYSQIYLKDGAQS